MGVTPAELLPTIYLGDRACKGIDIDAWDRRVSVQVDVISRIRSPSGTWDYYSDEDIPDGRLVFAGVTAVSFNPSGPVPNGFISDVRIAETRVLPAGKEAYVFVLAISSVDDAGRSTEVTVEIHAADLYLADPTKPGEEIRS